MSVRHSFRVLRIEIKAALSAGRSTTTDRCVVHSNISCMPVRFEHVAFDAPLAAFKRPKAAFKALDGVEHRPHWILGRKVHRASLRLARFAAEKNLLRKLLSSAVVKQLRCTGLFDHPARGERPCSQGKAPFAASPEESAGGFPCEYDQKPNPTSTCLQA